MQAPGAAGVGDGSEGKVRAGAGAGGTGAKEHPVPAAGCAGGEGRGVVRGGKARWGEARGGERRGLRPTLGNPSVRAPPPSLPGFAAFLPVPTPSLESRATERPPQSGPGPG